MTKSRKTEFGDFWRDGSPEQVHGLLGNASWAWLMWVFTLEQSAAVIALSASYIERRSDETMMPGVFAVRAMLMGYAIECALKGFWVSKGNVIASNGRYVRIPNTGDHNLLQISQAVGFEPTAKEADVLKRLSIFATFAGRYPIAKTSEGMAPNNIPAVGPVDVAFFSKQDFRVTQSVLNKIIALISGKKRRLTPHL
jgi:hypothetical protein